MINELYEALVKHFTEEIQSDLTFELGADETITATLEDPNTCGYSTQVASVNTFINTSPTFKHLWVELDGDYEKEFQLRIIKE